MPTPGLREAAPVLVLLDWSLSGAFILCSAAFARGILIIPDVRQLSSTQTDRRSGGREHA